MSLRSFYFAITTISTVAMTPLNFEYTRFSWRLPYVAISETNQGPRGDCLMKKKPEVRKSHYTAPLILIIFKIQIRFFNVTNLLPN
jgi:hypothetical protein